MLLLVMGHYNGSGQHCYVLWILLTAVKNIIVVDAGKESGWNNPEPNSVYKMDGDKTCHTNYLVRPAWVKTTLKAYVKDLKDRKSVV